MLVSNLANCSFLDTSTLFSFFSFFFCLLPVTALSGVEGGGFDTVTACKSMQLDNVELSRSMWHRGRPGRRPRAAITGTAHTVSL